MYTCWDSGKGCQLSPKWSVNSVQDNKYEKILFHRIWQNDCESKLQCKYYKIIEIILRKKSKFERLLPYLKILLKLQGFPGSSVDKKSIYNAGDVGSIPGGEHRNPLQYSCLRTSSTEEPGVLQFIGSNRARQDWID